MKTSYVVIAVVVLVLLAGGGYFLATQNNKPASTAMQPSAAPIDDPDMDGDADNSTETTMASPSSASGEAMTADTKAGDVQEVTVQGSNFKFEPSTITVKKGQPVKITFKNVQGFHDFMVDGIPDAKTSQIQSPNEATVTFTPTKAGTFEYYCSVGKHRQMGMKGTLVVQ